jgi:putative salt-induced outer membrane protein
MMLKKWSPCLLLLVPVAAFAEWSGKGEAGFVLARGNTNTDTANAKVEMMLDKAPWKYTFGGSGIHASDDAGATAQRWEVHLQSNYDFSPRNFWFGAARYDDDRFSGFYYQASVTTGVGHKFIDTDSAKLSGQLGAGYKMLETRPALAEDGVTLMPANRSSQAVASGLVDYSQTLTSTTTLLDKLTVEAGSQNTFVEDVLSLQVKVNQSLALAVAYTARYNSNPPTGFRSTDTLTTLNLVFEMKASEK